MKIIKLTLFVLVFFSITISTGAEGFLKVSGKMIVDQTGNNYYLKGIGLGGWLVQEGYMLKTSGFANAEHQIRSKITDLIGEEKTQSFYEKYWENYVREIDVKNIAEWGFNSIRLPMHYNKLTDLSNTDTYYESGFQMIDSLLSWCKKYNIYLILDLHAAPGGQSDEGISDYNPAYPSLWESEVNKQTTVKLWRKIAERYANEEMIGGYDLINEPKWELGPGNVPLRELYEQITAAIREVDTNHIIFVEGNWYATDFSGLSMPWDDDLVYSFHKYWNSNDMGAIQYLLSFRNQNNRPLWLGETGENSNAWFTDCIKLMKQENIGWAWWPHKKISSIAGPLSAEISPQYQTLLNYWGGSGSKPSVDYAYAALMMQADKLKFENVRFQKDVIDAMMRQPDDDTTIPFVEHKIPGRIFAVDYDMGKRGAAYNDAEYQNLNTDGSRVWNSGWSYRNDGVDIEACTDAITNGYNVGWTETGDWLKFTVDVESSGVYDLVLRYAAGNSNGKITIAVDNQTVVELNSLISTGGWQNWTSKIYNNINLTAGRHEIMVRFFFGGFNVNYFEFIQKSVGVEDDELKPREFGLDQNYPNPFNGQTIIRYSLAKQSNVKLAVYDVVGQLIEKLSYGTQETGEYTVTWDSKDVNSGVYFIKLETDQSFSKTIKAVLIK